jgi:hypothetical protein
MTGNANSGDNRTGGRWGDRRTTPLTLAVPANVLKYLNAAAARRDMLPEDLALGLVGAVLTRGNIDEMLNKWHGYIFAGERPVPRDQYRTTNNSGEPVRAQDPYRGASEQTAEAGEVYHPSRDKGCGGLTPSTPLLLLWASANLYAAASDAGRTPRFPLGLCSDRAIGRPTPSLNRLAFLAGQSPVTLMRGYAHEARLITYGVPSLSMFSGFLLFR